MKFNKMTRVEVSYIEDSLIDMGINYHYNYETFTFTINNHKFTNKKDLEEYLELITEVDGY